MSEAKNESSGEATTSSELLGCICCASGNDFPDGEWCRACGLGLQQQPTYKDDCSPLGRAIIAARGGHAPTQKRGYA